MFVRKWLTALVLLLIICSLSAFIVCEIHDGEEIDKNQYRFVFIYPDSSEDWTIVNDGIDKYVTEFRVNNDVNIDCFFFVTENPTDQSATLMEWINSEADGICVAMPSMQVTYPIENVDKWEETIKKYRVDWEAYESLSKLIKNGIELGKTILTVGNDQFFYSNDPGSQYYWGDDIYMEQPSRLCFVGSDNFSLGRAIAEKAVNAQGGNAKIYRFGGWRFSTEQIYRRNGVISIVSENAERGAEFVDGNWAPDGHPYPFDSHGVFFVGKKRGDPHGTGEYIDWEQSCVCERYIRESVNLFECGLIQLNTYIGLWKGSNAISNVFREKGWDDADTNKEHFSILCGESPEVITALKDHFATCIFLEDRYEWGYQAAKTLIEIACQGKMPESDHIYTPSYIVDLSEVYDYYPDSE